MPALGLMAGNAFVVLADALDLVDQVLQLVVLRFYYLIEFLDHLVLPVVQLNQVQLVQFVTDKLGIAIVPVFLLIGEGLSIFLVN